MKKKAILISIKPEWIAKILNGEKTIEVRKTKPKCELPIEVYIYCTKAKPNLYRHIRQEFFHRKETFKAGLWNGMIVAKFTLRRVEKFDFISEIKYEGNPPKYNEEIRKHNRICKEACISPAEVVRYLDTKCLGSDNPSGMIGYAWHIEDLIIFDRPRELREFHTNVKKEPPEELLCPECGKPMEYYEYKYLKKAPRSWQYIEVE